MELLGDVGNVEYSFFLFGDSVGVGYVTWVMWNLSSFRLETVLVSVQDRCIVCTKCTIVSEIVGVLIPIPLRLGLGQPGLGCLAH